MTDAPLELLDGDQAAGVRVVAVAIWKWKKTKLINLKQFIILIYRRFVKRLFSQSCFEQSDWSAIAS